MTLELTKDGKVCLHQKKYILTKLKKRNILHGEREVDVANNARREGAPRVGKFQEVFRAIEEVPRRDRYIDLAGNQVESRHCNLGVDRFVDADKGPAENAELPGRILEVLGNGVERSYRGLIQQE